jgi:hypothetical protein
MKYVAWVLCLTGCELTSSTAIDVLSIPTTSLFLSAEYHLGCTREINSDTSVPPTVAIIPTWGTLTE